MTKIKESNNKAIQYDLVFNFLKEQSKKHGVDINKIVVGTIGNSLYIQKYDESSNPVWKTLDIIQK